jgi:hypothetical protein
MGTNPSNPQPSGIFSGPPAERRFPTTALTIAGGGAVLLLGLLLIMKAHRPADAGPASASAVRTNTLQPLDPKASTIGFTDIAMSESTSLSGGKDMYIDGHVSNHGQTSVTGITVQVLFRNDEVMPPQIETLPVSLIRTHQPYVDTEPISSDPLGPGAEREFRLTFENIASNWNQQTPEILVIRVQTP